MAQQFASDNNAGICPEALEALLRANAEGIKNHFLKKYG